LKRASSSAADSEVRKPSRHALLANFGIKGRWQTHDSNLCPFEQRGGETPTAGRIQRTGVDEAGACVSPMVRASASAVAGTMTRGTWFGTGHPARHAGLAGALRREVAVEGISAENTARGRSHPSVA